MLDLKGGTKPQPTARAVAQMRMLTAPKGLPDAIADAMAEAGLSATMADKVIAGLVALNQHSKTFSVELADWQKLAEDLIAQSGADPAAQPVALAGELVMTHLAEKAPKYVSRNFVADGFDRGAGLQAKMTDGLLARMLPGHKSTMGQEFAGMSFGDLADFSLRNSGERNIGYLSSAKKITMAGSHTTSDFSISLANSVSRVLLFAYDAAQSAIKEVSHETTAKDFRPISSVRFSAGLALTKYSEGGEITSGTLDEGGESMSIAKYGKMFRVSLEALTNDDLGVFQRMGQIGGVGAALTEAQLFATLVTSGGGVGPTMSDTLALFHTSHGNLAGTAALMSLTSLGAGLTAMRRQTGPSGEKINVVPAYLLVPPELEILANQLTTQISAAQSSNVNPLANRLQVLVDPNLTSAIRWYLVSKPGTPECLKHAYLDSYRGPQIDQQWDFDTDTLSFRVREFFGVGFADWRGWFMNQGL